MDYGSLLIRLTAAREALPVCGRVVISRTVDGERILELMLDTDEEGLTQPVSLAAPDKSISLDPENTALPYTAYDVEVNADGYAPVLVEGVQIYSGVESYLPVNMLPVFSASRTAPDPLSADFRSASNAARQQLLHYTIPDPAVRSTSAAGPAPASRCSRPFVLDKVFIPEYITVHLGRPQSSAANETVSFPYYIKNVCSSEIYPTWPENAIRANIYAQISLALNRIFTEWYPSKGYSFNITNSTQYDQYYVSGRNIFTNISRIVDQIFNTYLRRKGDFAPYYAEYCNGTTVTCKGMSQWGTVGLAQSGLSPIQILRRYYGSNFELVTTDDVRTIPESYPGYALRRGSTGTPVAVMQRQLSRIAKNYPSIERLAADGIFGTGTERAVRTFQKIFNLGADGIVGRRTWYKISYIYVAVKKLAELSSESEPYPGDSGQSNGSGSGTLQTGAAGAATAAVQYYLSYLSRTFYPSIPDNVPDGIFGASTRAAVIAFQKKFGLAADGIVGPDTWGKLSRQFASAYDDNNPGSYFGAYPGIVLREGSRGLRVQQLQYYLLVMHYSYPSVRRIRADGIFGPATTAAVRAFQEVFGLSADGAVGISTWTRLYSAYSQQNAGLLSGDEIPEYPGYTLYPGSSGRDVQTIQAYLDTISLKYGSLQPVTPTGNYGQNTENAVRTFQHQFSLAETGSVNEATWNSIHDEYLLTIASGNLECRFVDASYPGTPVVIGQTGFSVRTALYYYNMIARFDLLLRPAEISSTFTAEDSADLDEFQLTRGLPVTGEVGAASWEVLYYQYVAAYRQAYPECADPGSVTAPFQTLYPGSDGIAVEQLQVWLNTLSGFFCDILAEDVSGVYTSVTESNVYRMQDILGLPVTGETDPATWLAIQSAYEAAIDGNNNAAEAQGDYFRVEYPAGTIFMTEGTERKSAGNSAVL